MHVEPRSKGLLVAYYSLSLIRPLLRAALSSPPLFLYRSDPEATHPPHHSSFTLPALDSVSPEPAYFPSLPNRRVAAQYSSCVIQYIINPALNTFPGPLSIPASSSPSQCRRNSQGRQ